MVLFFLGLNNYNIFCFTISDSINQKVESGNIRMVIRAAGSWTKKLVNMPLADLQRGGVRIEGPLGRNPPFNRYRHVVMV